MDGNGNGNTTVLIADDEPLSLRALGLILGLERYHLRLAGTARAAIATLAESPPDLIVVDRGMAGADGTALPVLLRRMAARVPMVIVSELPGRMSPPVAESVEVRRPVDAQRLREAVARQLRAPSSRNGGSDRQYAA